MFKILQFADFYVDLYFLVNIKYKKLFNNIIALVGCLYNNLYLAYFLRLSMCCYFVH